MIFGPGKLMISFIYATFIKHLLISRFNLVAEHIKQRHSFSQTVLFQQLFMIYIQRYQGLFQISKYITLQYFTEKRDWKRYIQKTMEPDRWSNQLIYSTEWQALQEMLFGLNYKRISHLDKEGEKGTLELQLYIYIYGLPWWLSRKEPACQCRRHGFDPQVGMISWERKWQPTPVFLPGKSHGQRSLAGYSP